MNFETNSAMYNNLPIFNLNNGNGQKQYSKMSSTSSDCFDYITGLIIIKYIIVIFNKI